MGSIGQYAGEMDIIENVYIENVTLLNGQVRRSSPTDPYYKTDVK